MIKWCSSFWKQRKARLPDCIRILSVRRNAATFQKERIALGQMAFRRERRSLRLPGPRAQPSAAALLTPKNPFCHFIILNLKWYKYYPSPFTQDLLKISFPAQDESSANTSSEPSDPLLEFRDDPIKLARGERGYIFPAFTSLPSWGGTNLGEPQWKEFDIAAFKEALKSLHQVDDKTKEREKEADKLSYYKKCMLNEKVWKSKGESEEPAPPVLKGDPRIDRLKELLQTELALEYEIVEGQSIDYGLHSRTIRGFRQLIEERRQECPTGSAYSEMSKKSLLTILRKHQRA